MILKLVTGCSWEDASLGLCTSRVLRDRRDAWCQTGVFAKVWDEALCAWDRLVGLQLDDVLIDGCQAKAPGGGEGVGRNPTDRGRGGYKRSVACDRKGIPVAVTMAGANTLDMRLVGRTLADLDDRGLAGEVETVHLDRGYDYRAVEEVLDAFGCGWDIKRRRKRGSHRLSKQVVSLGVRWPVERHHGNVNNAFGQMRRSTDRKVLHRYDWFALAAAVLIVGRLIRLYKAWGQLN
jgi:hypothetical protein